MEDKKDYVVGNIVFNNKPEKIIPLNELPDEFKGMMSKIKLLHFAKMINNLKEFKDYYCKYRCEYKSNNVIEDCPCDYCQIDNFINMFELENM